MRNISYSIEMADIQATLLYAAELAKDRVINLPRSLSDLELYDSFPSSKRLKNDCHALIRPFMERFSTLMRLFLPFGQSYPASTWSRFKL